MIKIFGLKIHKIPLRKKDYIYLKTELFHTLPRPKREKYLSTKKAIISGNVIEITNYTKPIFYGYEEFHKEHNSKVKDGKKRKDNISKTMHHLRQLINTNIELNSKFITLTFAEHVTDISVAKDEFKKFAKRLNYINKCLGIEENLKYIYVIEFTKIGRIHFHCIFFNLQYIENNKLANIWRNGFIRINNISKVDNVGAYVIKYMSKATDDKRLQGYDLYGRSRGNLKEPIIVTKDNEVYTLEKTYKQYKTYEKTYQTDWHGDVTYSQYKLKVNRKLEAIYNKEIKLNEENEEKKERQEKKLVYANTSKIKENKENVKEYIKKIKCEIKWHPYNSI